MWTALTINNRITHILRTGTQGPVFIWPFFPHRGDELDHMEGLLNDMLPGFGITVIACEVTDWNLELSPWKGVSIDGSMLGGGGADFLNWIQNSLFPRIDGLDIVSQKCYMMGYSLAGLFAMWSLYETDLFDGVVCGSGSFWFEGWSEYAKTHSLRKKASIYLSLGGKEDKTDHPLMATVGTRTKELETLLKADPLTERIVFELNSGGHFADSVKRLIKGILWTVR